jgi:hypothetical protein
VIDDLSPVKLAFRRKECLARKDAKLQAYQQAKSRCEDAVRERDAVMVEEASKKLALRSNTDAGTLELRARYKRLQEMKAHTPPSAQPHPLISTFASAHKAQHRKRSGLHHFWNLVKTIWP